MSDSAASPQTTGQHVRGLITLAAVGGLAFVGFYVAFVWLPIGQRWDDRALLGGLLASDEARRALTSALHGIRVSTIILMVALILMIGIARRQLRTAVIVSVAFGGAILSAEILKRVLPRRDLAPELNAYVDNGNIDTYPSGHATIAMAFALGLLVTTSPRYRPAVAAFAMLWACAIPMAALAAGWHRPSDVLGGMALALTWMAAAAAIGMARPPRHEKTASTTRYLMRTAVLVLLICATAVAAWVWWGDPSQVPVGGGFAAFLLGEAGVAIIAVGTVAMYVVALTRANSHA